MIDAGEGDVADELVQEVGSSRSVSSAIRFLGEDYILGRGRVRRQQPPVDESAVTKVWVLKVLSSQ